MRRKGEATSEGFVYSFSFLPCPSWASIVLDHIYASGRMMDGGVWPEASVDPILPRRRPLCFHRLVLYMSRTQKGGRNVEDDSDTLASDLQNSTARLCADRARALVLKNKGLPAPTDHAQRFIELSPSRKVSISYCAFC